MCGIAGIFNPNRVRDPDRVSSVIEAMLDAERYRGPDNLGVWSDEYAGLGTARLKITGGARRGNQPLIDDGGGVFVFNGECYEPERIAACLGKTFDASQSDGVALSAMLRSVGVSGLEGISAMFALARYEPSERSLLLARDAFGQKPLYYTQLEDGTLVYGSTIAALHVVAGPFDVRPNAIDEYLLFRSVGGCSSAFNGIEQVPPGSWMCVDSDGGITRGCWYQLPEPRGSEAPSPEELEGVLLDAIEKRVPKDYRPTVFLSGGLDSSIVASGVMHRCADVTRPLGLSIGYDVGGFEDETEFARRFAEELGMQHEIVVLKSDEVPDLLADVAQFLEDPIQDPITVATLKLARAAGQETKVVLTGDGSDEFWCGYDRFADVPDTVEAYLPRAMTFHPSDLGLDEYPASYLDRIPIDEGMEPIDRFMRLEIRNRMRNYHLARLDKLTMAASVEARCPFLDVAVTTRGLETPGTLKRDGATVKVQLHAATRNLVPEWMRARKKQPFTSPIIPWLRGSMHPVVRALPTGGHDLIRERIDVSGLVDSFESHGDDDAIAGRIWSLVILDIWLQAVAARFARPASELLDDVA